MDQTDITARIREEAARLLAEGRVDVVIGFEEGSLPMRSTPCFATSAADTGRLVWNSFCSNNLARYLARMPGRTGLVAKACDTRALVELVKENQVRREDIVVIGVPCRGMIDPRAVREKCMIIDVSGVDDSGDTLAVAGKGAAASMPRDEALFLSCRLCGARDPVLADIVAGTGAGERREPGFDDVDEFAALPPRERRAFIGAEMERCIRCNACRNACPLCYCSRCFADDTLPQWVGRGTAPNDVLSFHLMRALHLAGRCVECGACARACPMGVDLGKLNRRLSADVFRLFGYRAGMDPGTPSPLSTFAQDDPQDFLLEPGRSCECRE